METVGNARREGWESLQQVVASHLGQDMGRGKKEGAQMYKPTGFLYFIAYIMFCFILNKGEKELGIFISSL